MRDESSHPKRHATHRTGLPQQVRREVDLLQYPRVEVKRNNASVTAQGLDVAKEKLAASKSREQAGVEQGRAGLQRANEA